MTFVTYSKNTKKVRDNLKANIKRYKELADEAFEEIERYKRIIEERDNDLKHYLEIVEAMEGYFIELEKEAKEKKDGKT